MNEQATGAAILAIAGSRVNFVEVDCVGNSD
jgi:hypothetical protein